MTVTTNGTSALETCGHCGCIHFGKTCDRVKAMEYYPDGTLKRVEYHEPKMIVNPTPPPSYPWWHVPPWTCRESGVSSTTITGVTMGWRDEGIMVN